MSEIIWQLPVNQSNKTDHDWVHPKAKYHAYVNNNSLCGKYGQNTNYFETTGDIKEIMSKPQIACNTCFKKAMNR